MKIFLFVTGLLIPISMVLFGYVMKNHSPKNINGLYGYRTSMSMKNRKTWKFANTYCGELWLKFGAVMTAVTLIILFAVMNTSAYEWLTGTITMVQVGVMIIPIILVEKALKKKFDRNGIEK